MNDTLSDTLLSWFAANQRPLPWRDSYDPYQVWISEVMLQQTQMDRAVEYFKRFTARFPDIHTLARASEEDVLSLWEGLGYYTRGLNLLKAAQVAVQRHGGSLPTDHTALRALPGVGDYTAGAILSIAHNQDVPAVDANVERVLARLTDADQPFAGQAGRKRLRDMAAALIPPGRARDFNQALMELGGLICKPKAPRCGECPLASSCLALARGTVLMRPVKPAPPAVVPIDMGTGVIVHEGLFFIQKREPKGVWGGLWEFPGGRIEPGETPRQAALREVLEETGYRARVLDKLMVIHHAYTRYRVTIHAFLMAMADEAAVPPKPVLTAATSSRWASLGDLDRLAFPTAFRKLIAAMAVDARLCDVRRQAGPKG